MHSLRTSENLMRKLADRRVLVTGGAGFLGSNIVERLLELGSEVTVLDDFFTGKREFLTDHPKLHVETGDVRDEEKVRQLMREQDFAIHEAARNIIISSSKPKEDLEVNVGGTANVMLAVRDSDVERVVHASSASVYGNPRGLLLSEDEMPTPLSVYAAGKVAAEQYCLAFHETYMVPLAILRYFNVYGKNQLPRNPYAGVVAKFFQRVLFGQAPEVHGNGEQTRDFTYVSDAVDATLLALVSPQAEGNIFNVGTGVETSVNRLAEEIIQMCGMNGQLRPVHIERRDIDNVRRRCANIEKIRRSLRWEPKVSLHEGLRLTAAWLKGKT